MDHTVALIEIFDVLRKMTIIITLWGFVTYFNPHIKAQAKMSLSRAQNIIIYAGEHKLLFC